MRPHFTGVTVDSGPEGGPPVRTTELSRRSLVLGDALLATLHRLAHEHLARSTPTPGR